MTEKRKQQLEGFEKKRKEAYELNQQGKSYDDIANEWGCTTAEVARKVRKYKKDNGL